MKIDKSRFLLLTGAIAAATMVSVGAAGCVITTNDKDSTEDTDGGTTPGPDAGLDDDADAASPDDPDASPDADASTDPDADEPDPPACLDDSAPAVNCFDALPTSCAEVCEYIVDSDWGLKSGVLQEMVSCLGSLPSCDDGIVSDEAWACRDDAVAKACVTNNDKEICEPLVTSCATEGWENLFTQEVCEQTIAAIDENEQERFVICVTEGIDDFCTADPMYCLLQTEDARVWD